VTILDRGLVLTDESGELARMVGVFRDVTERREAQQLRQSEFPAKRWAHST
jgi:hypothetical protein